MGIGHEIDRVRVGVVTTSSPTVWLPQPAQFFQQEYIMNRPEKVIYTAKVHTTGGRVGSSRSDDGKLDVKLTRPGTSALAPIQSNCSPRAGRPATSRRWNSWLAG
jgi:Predicted redox protein, regulator of disulfide bond formation